MTTENNLPPKELKEADAFNNYNQVATSFSDGLEKSILEFTEKNETVLVSEILQRYGNYEKVHDQIKRLLLDNKLILYELEPNSINENRFNAQKVKVVDHSLSEWVDLAAQPCLNCPVYNECGLDNPVSPATCKELDAWIQEEIELEFKY